MQERFIARQMQRWRSPINENMETPVGMQPGCRPKHLFSSQSRLKVIAWACVCVCLFTFAYPLVYVCACMRVCVNKLPCATVQ